MNKARLTARPHLIFLLGLGFSLYTAIKLEQWSQHAQQQASPHMEMIEQAKIKRIQIESVAQREIQKKESEARLGDRWTTLQVRSASAVVSPELREIATRAWEYFEKNHQISSGFVNSVNQYPSSSMWDLSAYAMAILAMDDLGLLAHEIAMQRLHGLLDGLREMPLVMGKLPNKAYNTKTLSMVDYNNNVVKDGIGWSAIDLGRIIVPLTIMLWRYPELNEKLRAILSRWQFQEIVGMGEMLGAEIKEGEIRKVQEGRLGYEQYAAKALALVGLDVSQAIRTDRYSASQMVENVPILYDNRLPGKYGGTHNAVVSEPYFLEAFEFGLSEEALYQSKAIYIAQQNRADYTKHLIAVSEDHIDRPPYFVYNSILNNNIPWECFSSDHKEANAHRSLSTKAAFAWSMLFNDAYADALRTEALKLYEPGLGYVSGRYDADQTMNKAITSNTNGIMIEAIWYHVRGPLLSYARQHKRI
jgi:hypothetical protein